MAAYLSSSNQPARLGKWDSSLGQGGEAYITAIGNAIHQTVSAIENNKTIRTDIKARRDVSIVTTTEDTKKLAIATQGATSQAAINVDRIRAQYGTLAQVILWSGVALMGLALAGGISYRLATKKRR